ncbi:hypothetical protein MRB53_030368 [Persea americana]|uniref:Uncharacterized protein n=1 Tax=Persea americana TaxID=3435 RepID=A0ACC2KLK6_PERAE|nr:hypothetical protein MRB53_030368 [Persea americana]
MEKNGKMTLPGDENKEIGMPQIPLGEDCKLQEEKNGDGRSGASRGGIGDDENSGFEEASMQRRTMRTLASRRPRCNDGRALLIV